MQPAATAANSTDARKPRVLQEFVVVDLPPDHPARHQNDAPVPPGVEEEDESEKAAAKNGKDQKASSTLATLSTSSFLNETPPPPVRLPDAAIERASAGLRSGDEEVAKVLREVFGDALPWTEKELFGSSSKCNERRGS